MEVISVTFEVSKELTFKLCKYLHPENIEFIDRTSVVFKLFMNNSFNS